MDGFGPPWSAFNCVSSYVQLQPHMSGSLCCIWLLLVVHSVAPTFLAHRGVLLKFICSCLMYTLGLESSHIVGMQQPSSNNNYIFHTSSWHWTITVKADQIFTNLSSLKRKQNSLFIFVISSLGDYKLVQGWTFVFDGKCLVQIEECSRWKFLGISWCLLL